MFSVFASSAQLGYSLIDQSIVCKKVNWGVPICIIRSIQSSWRKSPATSSVCYLQFEHTVVKTLSFQFFPLRDMSIHNCGAVQTHNLGTDFNVTWNRVVSLNYERIDKSKESFSLKMAAKEDKIFFKFNYEYTDFAKVCFVKLNLIGLFLSWDEGLRLLLSEMICFNTMSL